MNNNYPNNHTFDFKDFNNKCREKGLMPFPFDSMTIEIHDDHHLMLHARNKNVAKTHDPMVGRRR